MEGGGFVPENRRGSTDSDKSIQIRDVLLWLEIDLKASIQSRNALVCHQVTLP